MTELEKQFPELNPAQHKLLERYIENYVVEMLEKYTADQDALTKEVEDV